MKRKKSSTECGDSKKTEADEDEMRQVLYLMLVRSTERLTHEETKKAQRTAHPVARSPISKLKKSMRKLFCRR